MDVAREEDQLPPDVAIAIAEAGLGCLVQEITLFGLSELV